jgi:DNA-binding PadR family transcriptional regulator
MMRLTLLLERGLFRVYVLWMCHRGTMSGDDFINIEMQHGHELSAGRLYPVLAELADAGYLAAEERNEHGKLHKYYHTTDVGMSKLSSIKRDMGAPMKEFLVEWLREVP